MIGKCSASMWGVQLSVNQPQPSLSPTVPQLLGEIWVRPTTNDYCSTRACPSLLTIPIPHTHTSYCLSHQHSSQCGLMGSLAIVGMQSPWKTDCPMVGGENGNKAPRASIACQRRNFNGFVLHPFTWHK